MLVARSTHPRASPNCPDIMFAPQFIRFHSIYALLRAGNIQHGDAGARAQLHKIRSWKLDANKTRISGTFFA
jgi:hypothetical protein